MTKRVLNSLKIGKIAAVDVPCQEHAQAAIMKRSEIAKAMKETLAKAGLDPSNAETFAEKFEDQLLLQNLWDDYWKAQSALQQSIESIVKDDSVTDKAAMIKQSLDEFCDYVSSLYTSALVPDAVTQSLAAGLKAALNVTTVTKGQDPMTDAIKKALGLPLTATEADVTKALADNATKLAAAEALAKSNELLAKMSDKHKAFMADGKMPEGGKEAFAAMSADKRDAHIKDCGGGDEDVAKALAAGDAFKAADGAIIRKSDFKTDTAFAFAKAQAKTIADQADAIAKRDEADAVSTFAKRATDLGFGADFGPTMRKAYSGDAAAQAEVEKRIKALNAQVEAGGVFDTFGKNNPKPGSVEAEFMAKVDEFKKANPTLSHAQAYTRVLKARDNADIVKRMRTEQGAN